MAAAEVLSLDPREVHGDAVAVPGAPDRDPMTLEAADPGPLPGREDADRIALGHRARDGRTGDDDTVPAHHERPVDRHAKVSGRHGLGRGDEPRRDLAAQHVEALARDRRHGDDGRAVERRVERQDLDLLPHRRHAACFHEVDLRDHEDAAPDAEEV